MMKTMIAMVAIDSIEGRIYYAETIQGLIVLIDLIAIITSLDILESMF